jgi:hypothetical protein
MNVKAAYHKGNDTALQGSAASRLRATIDPDVRRSVELIVCSQIVPPRKLAMAARAASLRPIKFRAISGKPIRREKRRSVPSWRERGRGRRRA